MRQEALFLQITNGSFAKDIFLTPMISSFRTHAALVLLLAGGPLPAQTLLGSFFYEGLLRDYRLYVPPSYVPGNKTPLVINMHGYTSNAFQQELYSEFNALASDFSFIVVYPNGVGNAWNSGFFAGGVNDVGFLSALIDSLAQDYSLDAARIYATGMSNGGFMSYHLACELSERIAAIASVTGTMSTYTYATCQPGRAVPVLEMHGTADDVVPFGGTIGMTPIPEVMDFWVANNQCSSQPDSAALPDLAQEGSTVTRFRWTGGTDSSEVELYRIAGGGHSWPGAFPLPGISTNQDIDGSRLIWEFFARHPHPAPSVLLSAPVQTARPLLALPNPAEGRLALVQEADGGAWLEITDLSGRRWLSEPWPAGSSRYELDISSWPSGIYIATRSSAQGLSRTKILRP
jgi:polyhydroxybutyrate depolymerase